MGSKRKTEPLALWGFLGGGEGDLASVPIVAIVISARILGNITSLGWNEGDSYWNGRLGSDGSAKKMPDQGRGQGRVEG